MITTNIAIYRKSAAAPTKWLLQQNGLISGDVLHYGRGHDIYTAQLLQKHPKVTSVTEYDPNQPDINSTAYRRRKYDTVICNFVLNILPPGPRLLVLKDIRSITKGSTIFAVRGQSDRGYANAKRKWPSLLDGFSNGKNFQKYYTKEEMYNELSKVFSFVDILKASNYIIGRGIIL